VADVERYVSDKIEEVKNTSADQTTLNIIILAALNIADEYLRLKGEKENFYKELEIKSEKLIQFIEERQ